MQKKSIATNTVRKTQQLLRLINWASVYFFYCLCRVKWVRYG